MTVLRARSALKFIALIFLMLSALAACSSEKGNMNLNDKPVVTGKITYDGKATLPADAVILVTLFDASVEDRQVKELGQQVIKNVTQFPISFSIPYSAKSVEPNARIAVSARIERAGKLLFLNNTRIYVLTNGYPSKDVQLPVISVTHN